MSTVETAQSATNKWRRWVTWLLVVITSIALLASALGLWAHGTVVNTDRFMTVVAPTLESPETYEALADYMSAELIEALDLESRLEARLTELDQALASALLDLVNPGDRLQMFLEGLDRPTLAELAPSLAASIETRIDRVVQNLVTSEQVRETVPVIVEGAHSAVMSLAQGDLDELPNVYLQDGEVRLNLLPIFAQVLTEVGQAIRGLLPDVELPAVISERADEAIAQLRASLGESVPDDFGQITVMTEDDLDALQAGMSRFDRFVWVWLAVTLILVTVTILTSQTRRRTVMHLAFGTVIALFVAFLVARRVQSAIVDAFQDPATREVMRGFVRDLFRGLRLVVAVLIVVLGVLAVGAYLAGEPEWYVNTKVRANGLVEAQTGGSKLSRWVDGHFGILRAAAIGMAVVALYLVGVGLTEVVVIGALLGLALWGLSYVRAGVKLPVEVAQ